MGRIPWSKIVAYCEKYDCDEEQTEDAVVLIGEMDRADLKKASDKSKAEERAKAPRRRGR